MTTIFSRSLCGLALVCALLPAALAQTAEQPPAAPAAAPPAIAVQGGQISGSVKSGKVGLPGVTVSAANTLTGKKVVTTTDLDGSFVFSVPRDGRYVVKADMAAFEAKTQEVRINAESRSAKVDFELQLASVAQAERQKQQSQQQDQGAQAASTLAGRGFQSLGLSNGETGETATVTQNGNAGNVTADTGAAAALPTAAMGGDVATESVSVSGAMGQSEGGMNEEEIRQRIEEARNQAGNQGGGPFGGGGGPAQVMILGPGMGGGGGRGGRGGFGRFNVNQPHGMLFLNAANSALDAKPYSLTGESAAKPDYAQERIGAVLGGPLVIPHIYNGQGKTFFFANYFASLAANPFDTFLTVPTLDERNGDFSKTVFQSGPNAGQHITIYDPKTGQPFPNNLIPKCPVLQPGSCIDPNAAALLDYIAKPNQSMATQNFHRTTSTDSTSHNFNFRIMQNLSGSSSSGSSGGRGGGGGPAALMGMARNSLNVGFNYRVSNNDIANSSPFLGGVTDSSGYNINVGYIRGRGRLNNRFNFSFNSNDVFTHNLFTRVTDVEKQVGITKTSRDPQDFGVPTLSFVNYSGLRDVGPLKRHDVNWNMGYNAGWGHKKHNLRFGFDFHRNDINLHSNSNPRGTFTFTGFATSHAGAQSTGYDLADFLLGMPQQTSAQFGSGSYKFLGNTWNAFVQDDWRIRSKLTFNLGLRYEYISPYTEAHNRLVNLDANGDFTAVAAVQPGQTGPFSGAFPRTLVQPDRNNFAPRIGIAWNPRDKLVVRGGYGINYNVGAYSSFVQQLAFQPPFAFTQTNITSPSTPLTLENGFPATTSTLTNNYGIDRNYRIGYVQNWNLEVQHEPLSGVIVNLGYNGAKGTRLDMVRAPNRGPTGLRIPNVQAFLWQTSDADSIYHGGHVSVRKRMKNGFSVGGRYTYSKSIDNASTIGGGATVVAQNDLDLRAERGLSSFDRRHVFNADYTYELPFGSNKRWLNSNNFASHAFGDWTWSGNVNIASGFPYTARVIGNFADVARGTNGTLRANVTGQPISISNPGVLQFFNTAAFTLPAPGQFGDAGRNTIPGPGTVDFSFAIMKNIQIKDFQALQLRASASNLFNTPRWGSIDTVVNSPTFGHVTSAGSMRKFQLTAQYRF